MAISGDFIVLVCRGFSTESDCLCCFWSLVLSRARDNSKGKGKISALIKAASNFRVGESLFTLHAKIFCCARPTTVPQLCWNVSMLAGLQLRSQALRSTVSLLNMPFPAVIRDSRQNMAESTCHIRDSISKIVGKATSSKCPWLIIGSHERFSWQTRGINTPQASRTPCQLFPIQSVWRCWASLSIKKSDPPLIPLFPTCQNAPGQDTRMAGPLACQIHQMLHAAFRLLRLIVLLLSASHAP